ncbi:MAG: sigma-70 family RNA polymerase sigma factor [Myxococcales bacterium]|nr:sigma-70 family RNA polymerase sigma factor [Myxococcales bacterium]
MSLADREQHTLVEAHLGLGRALARAAVRRAPHLGYDELVGVASEALVRAARRYDPTTGVPFHCFSFKRVRGALLRACRDGRQSAWIERMLRAEHDARPEDGGPAPTGDTLLCDASPHTGRARAVRWAREAAASAAFAVRAATPEALVAGEQAHGRALAALRAAVAELPGDERRFVALYYESGATLDEAARELGVAKRTVQRLHDRVKASLALALSKRGVSEPPSAR